MDEIRSKFPTLFHQIESDMHDKNWNEIYQSLLNLNFLNNNNSISSIRVFIDISDRSACETLVKGDTFSICSFPAVLNWINGLIFREIQKDKRKELITLIHEHIPNLNFWKLSKSKAHSSTEDPQDLAQSIVDSFSSLRQLVQIASMHISHKFEKKFKKTIKTYLNEIFYNEIVFIFECRFKQLTHVQSIFAEFIQGGVQKTREKTLYFGELAGEVREGFGRASFSNGEKYEGEWENDCFHGNGIYLWNKEEWFSGTFVSGKMQGTGTRRFKNGSVYSGEFFNGKMQGKGKIIFKNGDVYEGEWLSDCMHGVGEYTWHKSGDKFRGIMRGDIKQSGTIVLESGEEYKV